MVNWWLGERPPSTHWYQLVTGNYQLRLNFNKGPILIGSNALSACCLSATMLDKDRKKTIMKTIIYWTATHRNSGLQTNRCFRGNSYNFSNLQEGEIELFFLRHLQLDPLFLPRLPPPVPLLGLPGQPSPPLGRRLLTLRQEFLKRENGLSLTVKSRIEPGSI